MLENLVVEFSKFKPIEEKRIEVVERKGLGHPDTLCDAIAEEVSRRLCKEYLRRFGRILHHNTDQVEVVGGSARPEFGGGELLKPIYVLIGGRATTRVNGEEILVGEVAKRAAYDYLERLGLRREWFAIDEKIGQGSANLRAIFERERRRANDTSLGVGYAPLSTTEKLVLESERFIQRLGLKGVGRDVKVMGSRIKDKVSLTIAAAIVSKHVDSPEAYRSVVEELREKVEEFASSRTELEVKVKVNAADDYERGIFYLTVTGLSAEQGDDGSVGRGNRANGLITPCRPMSLEAVCGKNPVNHVGKLYNLLAFRIAEQIVEAGAREAYVRILSQIGQPIEQPKVMHIEILGPKELEGEARRIASEALEAIEELTKLCVEGRVQVF